MKFSMLSSIVHNYVKYLKDCAAYSGMYHDGGAGSYRQKFEEYKTGKIYEMALRPSEYYKLDDIEVEEPSGFQEAIRYYKQQLVNDMKL